MLQRYNAALHPPSSLALCVASLIKYARIVCYLSDPDSHLEYQFQRPREQIRAISFSSSTTITRDTYHHHFYLYTASVLLSLNFSTPSLYRTANPFLEIYLSPYHVRSFAAILICCRNSTSQTIMIHGDHGRIVGKQCASSRDK